MYIVYRSNQTERNLGAGQILIIHVVMIRCRVAGWHEYTIAVEITSHLVVAKQCSILGYSAPPADQVSIIDSVLYINGTSVEDILRNAL